jgi:hypothetical protein
VTLLVLVTSSLAGGCAERAGSGAASGAVQALREAPADPNQRVAVRIGSDTAEGTLGKLSSPEGVASISKIVDAAVAQSLATVLQHPAVAGRRGGGMGRSPIARMGGDVGAGFTDALTRGMEDALGPDGRGPLATSLEETASLLSASAVRGVREGLGGALLSGCALDDRPCLEAAARSLGRAASTGFVEGLVSTAALPALALAFVLGVVVALLARSLLGSERRHRPPEHREAHP